MKNITQDCRDHEGLMKAVKFERDLEGQDFNRLC